MTITVRRRSGTTTAPPEDAAAAGDELEGTFLVARVADRSVALFASRIEEVQPAAQLEQVPGAGPAVEGFVNLHGEIVPVFDGRRLLGLPSREIRLTDLFLVVKTAARRAVLHVDAAPGLTNLSMGEIAAAAAATSEALGSSGIAHMPDGLLVVHDTDAFVLAHEMTQAR